MSLRISGWRGWCGALGAVVGVAVFLSASAAPPQPQAAQGTARELVLTVDPTQSKVHYSVDSTLHTVHGTFAVKSGEVHLDTETGAAGGEIIVLATSGDSGNSGRDERMHREILETRKYPEAVFRPTKVEGKVSRSGASDVTLRGVMTLHGTEHAVAAQVHAEVTGDRWKGTARFSVPYVEWGIKDASNFFLRVKKVVNVNLEMTGSAKGAG